ncbi:MAG TPA: hypothetical protein VE078_03775 [Thermoanaerobaculia bacterium]|nr:hypothetical protein [Thermoanaerobaculia bacterium]
MRFEPAGQHQRPAAIAALLVLLTAGTAGWLAAAGRIPFTSDQSIISLMALDILQKGAHPVFCYGAQYGGTLESHYLAVVFSILRPSPLAFQLAMGVLVIAIVLVVWAMARFCYGERAGLLAGLYLAMGPSFFFYKGLTSDGAYASLFLVCGLGVWLLLVIERRLAEGRHATLHLALLGWLLGLAWWILPISAFMAAAGAAAVVAGVTRAWLAPGGVTALLAAFLLGGLPWWWHNLQTGWASLKAPELAAAPISGTAARLASLFRDGWSILLGASSVTTGEVTFPGSRLLAWAVLAALIGFGLVSLRRGPTPAARHGSVVFLAVLVAVPCLALLVARTDFAEPRYLLPAYLGIAPLAGGLIATLWERRTAGAVLATALLLALNLGSQIGSPRLKNRLRIDGTTWVESDPREVVRRLRERAVDAVYASYWVAYRTTFLSGGKVIASPFGSGNRGLVRHLEHQAFVDRHPAPAFLLNGRDRSRFESYLSRFGIPHRRESFEGLTLFSGLPPEAVTRIRSCNCIPESPPSRRVIVLSPEAEP